jgi:hypothetical protein
MIHGEESIYLGKKIFPVARQYLLLLSLRVCVSLSLSLSSARTERAGGGGGGRGTGLWFADLGDLRLGTRIFEKSPHLRAG